MTVVVMLPHRNQAQLDDLLRRIAKGQARPISHAQFVSTYAPDPLSVAAVAAGLQSIGFTIAKKTESIVFAEATTAVVERTFGTPIHNIRNIQRYDAYYATQSIHVPFNLARFAVTVSLDRVPLRWVR
jgi:subtilase family serine protease